MKWKSKTHFSKWGQWGLSFQRLWNYLASVSCPGWICSNCQCQDYRFPQSKFCFPNVAMINLWWQHEKSKKFKYELNLNHYQNRCYATVFFDKIHFFQLNCKQRIVYPNNPGYWLPDRLLVRWIILDWHQFQPGQVWAIRSSHQGSSVKKAVLKSFAKCFPAKFAKYLRTRILKKICEWLLLSLFLFWWKRKYSKRLDVCCYRS